MILIDSGFSEGICYVETSSLDGEKTLKLKVANKYTRGFISNDIKDNKGIIKICAGMIDNKGQSLGKRMTAHPLHGKAHQKCQRNVYQHRIPVQKTGRLPFLFFRLPRSRIFLKYVLFHI